MAQEKCLGKIVGLEIFDGPGNFQKKNPTCMPQTSTVLSTTRKKIGEPVNSCKAVHTFPPMTDRDCGRGREKRRF